MTICCIFTTNGKIKVFMVLRILFFFLLSLTAFQSFCQSELFALKHLTEEQKLKNAPFCVSNTPTTKRILAEKNIPIKFETNRWLYITTSAVEIQNLLNNNEIKDFFLEINPPALLNDSARARHFVNQVHQGFGLSSAYLGNDVIIGYVDTGIDFNHPDFKNADGTTRVLRYWDQTTDLGSSLSAYGYGIVWDSTQINAGTCTSMDGTAHGTTVAGVGSGDGSSTGYNHGMAPESDIIMVESNFDAPNWTLTVADACDYIFKVADSLGKPAVVNLSLGTYFGSHDGNDPASVFIESLLDAQKGRVVVSAAGNSANFTKYHCGASMDADTNFVWFNNNANGVYGANTVFFDLWSDSSEATFDYQFNVVRPLSNYETRGEILYRNALDSIGIPIYDTIWNANGNRLATLEIYTDYEDGNYHMQAFVSKLDTTSYKIGFYTTGSGSYDLWSGQNFGFNNMVTTLPSEIDFPSIIHYTLPDSLQTIVSSWNCSEKVISVGNIKNRSSYPTLSGGMYTPSDVIPVGKLSVNSSKGPSRVDVIKPDIVASGDVMLSAGPLWYLSNPVNYNKIDPGAWHMGNGGTSMSSPVIAGIAALFLERCSEANYVDFKNELFASAMPNNYTGTLPNYAYGHGLANAYQLLLANEFDITFEPLGLCQDPVNVEIVSSQPLVSVEWWNGQTQPTQLITSPTMIELSGFNENGCESSSGNVQIVQYDLPSISPISLSNGQLSTVSSDDYQWTINGNEIVGATNSTLNLGNLNGVFTCYTTSEDGCIAETSPFNYFLGVTNLTSNEILVFPNPTNETVTIKTNLEVTQSTIYDAIGRKLDIQVDATGTFDLGSFSNGIYTLLLETNHGQFQTKIIRR
jgi:hypothetical protein